MGLTSFMSSGGSTSTTSNQFAPELGDAARGLTAYAQRNQSPIVRPDATGFMPYQQQGLNVFANLLRGQSSADWASRGFNTPMANDAVTGSALTQALPNLFTIQNNNQLLPGQVLDQNISNRMNPFNLMLGGGQTSTSAQRGPGLGYNLAQAGINWLDPKSYTGGGGGGGAASGADGLF